MVAQLECALEVVDTRLGCAQTPNAARGAAARADCFGRSQVTSFSYKNCTVTEVMGMSDSAFGFNILNERAQPILSLAFKTRDDAAQARAEIAKAVAKAVEITRPALTAAGEP